MNPKLSTNSENEPHNSQDANRSKSTVQFKSKVIKNKSVTKTLKENNVSVKPTLTDNSLADTTTQLKKVIENKDEFSFTDTDCGETLQCQRIIIDFSQNESDSPVSRQKCKDFWDFINKNPHLDNFLTEHDSKAVE
ncbi:unnamed protein product [Pieris macdunnoughi]|uniref:Uncharacterized protein n=1 Tax=Pieris macdunnoughi TaxID=345717 RepID=A0A821YGI1_9NEOP|nr:unnamed protein product [Pieris macdunnoughi]